MSDEREMMLPDDEPDVEGHAAEVGAVEESEPDVEGHSWGEPQAVEDYGPSAGAVEDYAVEDV